MHYKEPNFSETYGEFSKRYEAERALNPVLEITAYDGYPELPDDYIITKEVLKFSETSLKNKGAIYIAQQLKNNATVKSLTIDDWNVGGVGLSAIAEMLKTNLTLEELTLSNLNDEAEGITEGVKAIAEALTTNSTLILLNLEYQYFLDNAWPALKEAIKRDGSNILFCNVNCYINDDVNYSYDIGPLKDDELEQILLKRNRYIELLKDKCLAYKKGPEAISLLALEKFFKYQSAIWYELYWNSGYELDWNFRDAFVTDIKQIWDKESNNFLKHYSVAKEKQGGFELLPLEVLSLIYQYISPWHSGGVGILLTEAKMPQNIENAVIEGEAQLPQVNRDSGIGR
ncbi:MAG: hypothetical protein K0R73_804 [Candidatus Midichloriaceae bacterium]|jgi:hypothetical protein|nr:hypothetical protein [Candidatus Midichloriaceae bacterium]